MNTDARDALKSRHGYQFAINETVRNKLAAWPQIESGKSEGSYDLNKKLSECLSARNTKSLEPIISISPLSQWLEAAQLKSAAYQCDF